jgi:hypothetical protein
MGTGVIWNGKYHWHTEKPAISFMIIENNKDHASCIGTVVECGNLEKFKKLMCMEQRRIWLI